MDKLRQKLKRRLEIFQAEDKNSKKVLLIGSLIATLIALSPYLFYLYESVPETQIWDTFLFTYDSKAWGDANYVMWVLTGKLVPLLYLFVWFFTCRHWWYHTILVPIVMYIFQITVMLNEDTEYMDEFQIIYLVPIMAVVVPSIYLIRAKMFNKINDANKTLEELEEEFMIKPTTFWGKVRQYF